MRHLRPLRLWFRLAILFGAVQPCWAHSMYQSALLLDYTSDGIHAELQLPASRLQQAIGTPVNQDDLPTLQVSLTAYIRTRIHVTTHDGRAWEVRFPAPLAWRVIDNGPYVVAEMIWSPPPGGSARVVVLEDDVITDTLPGHAVLVSVRSDWNSSTFANEPDLVGVLSGEERSLEVDRTQGSWGRGFASVFHLGVRHIAEGTDHLLFLLALLLPAPLLVCDGRWAGFAGIRHGFSQILQVVTAFTLGHSITLALAASGVVRVPGKPIEILIAVSILISAAHALRPLFPGREAFIAGGFGFIHGLAFASTLAELGLHRWERVASIFSFNLGIEAMQLVVVLCIMPSLMILSRTGLYGPFRILGGLFAGAAALGWIVERSFNVALPVDRVVDALAMHPVSLAGGLFAFALAASAFAPRGSSA